MFIITTDASDRGWGAHCLNQSAQWLWNKEERSHNINWRELRAIHLALLAFQEIIQGTNIFVKTDNTTAKVYVNKQWGTRSRSLHQETVLMLSWAESNLPSLMAYHVKGELNLVADWLSWVDIQLGEWALNPSVFTQITEKMGMPEVDLFMTLKNAQLPAFMTRFPCREAMAVDALSSPWPDALLYTYPPTPLLARVLQWMCLRARVLLVAPFWPRRPWFPELLHLAVEPPWDLPQTPDLLHQGPVLHPDPCWFQFTVWKLSGESSANMATRREFSALCWRRKVHRQREFINIHGEHSFAGCHATLFRRARLSYVISCSSSKKGSKGTMSKYPETAGVAVGGVALSGKGQNICHILTSVGSYQVPR
ncbi:uncharacterized protein LOC128328270 [Hemicordylus capensis]|uniref:uncharacterized protein LOC128328270 n=1 Tax=Hemicordylus capensis TaxID=884348 RepID=UPI0023032431|nr:uncharacterized protein LOC128328270 [Hemicordylus capensis]